MRRGSQALRPEQATDAPVVAALIEAAFRDHPHSNHDEQQIVERLRAAGALTLSLVAESDARIVGHIAFSPVMIGGADCGWHGLAPLAVAPHMQRRGVGRALVEHGLARLRALDAAGCVVAGDPAYYGRFGFARDAGLTLAGLPPEYFLALPFGRIKVRGAVHYHAAFHGAC